MRIRSCLLAAASMVFASGSVYAADSIDEAAKKAGCGGCHAADTKKVGPSFKDLGAKHKDSDKFIAAFKASAMHKSVKVSDGDLKTVADRATGK